VLPIVSHVGGDEVFGCKKAVWLREMSPRCEVPALAKEQNVIHFFEDCPVVESSAPDSMTLRVHDVRYKHPR
jgi:hypothetical protein